MAQAGTTGSVGALPRLHENPEKVRGVRARSTQNGASSTRLLQARCHITNIHFIQYVVYLSGYRGRAWIEPISAKMRQITERSESYHPLSREATDEIELGLQVDTRRCDKPHRYLAA